MATRHSTATRWTALRDRILMRIERIPGFDCWIWNGSHRKDGRGVVQINNRFYAAPRVVYEEFVGPIPPGMLVCHSCDVPACVNPAHLWLGTNLDNIKDMHQKGRGKTPAPRFGTDHPRWIGDHCRKGHPLSGDNVAYYSTGRHCKQCNRDRAAAVRLARKKGKDNEAVDRVY